MPSRKVIVIYLIWELVHLGFWISNGSNVSNDFSRAQFYPFPQSFSWHCFDLSFYDITELIFYTIAPVFIYYFNTIIEPQE
jgi:hypothetical protein